MNPNIAGKSIKYILHVMTMQFEHPLSENPNLKCFNIL
jgi:hypothetical protein